MRRKYWPKFALNLTHLGAQDHPGVQGPVGDQGQVGDYGHVGEPIQDRVHVHVDYQGYIDDQLLAGVKEHIACTLKVGQNSKESLQINFVKVEKSTTSDLCRH